MSNKFIKIGNQIKIRAKHIPKRQIISRNKYISMHPFTNKKPLLLKDYGYYDVLSLSVGQRKQRLEDTVRFHKPEEIFKKLVKLSEINHPLNPKIATIYRHDAIYITKKYNLSFDVDTYPSLQEE